MKWIMADNASDLVEVEVRVSGRVVKERPQPGTNDFWLEWRGKRMLVDCSVLIEPVDWWQMSQVQVTGACRKGVVVANGWRCIDVVDLRMQSRICDLLSKRNT